MVAPFGQNPSRQYSILPILNIVSSQSQSTAHLLTQKSVGRKCRSISRSDG
nr:MAG TPA: hypothetical protein [Caudoviricetes sp.]